MDGDWANTIPALVGLQVNKNVIRQLTDHITKSEFTYSPQTSNIRPIKFSQSLNTINAGKLKSILSAMSTMDNGRFKSDILALMKKAEKRELGNNKFVNLLDATKYNSGFSFTNQQVLEIKQLQLEIFNQALDLIRN